MRLRCLVVAIAVIAAVSGCVGSKDKIYTVEEVYQNPDVFKDKNGEWNKISIQGIAGTDAIYEIDSQNSYYFLAPDVEDRPPDEIIYISTTKGVPKAGSKVAVKGKIEKVLEAGKMRIITFVPVEE